MATLGAIESMGGILTEANKENIEKMSRDIASQAVEQIGLVDVTGKPFDWIRQRLRSARKVLVCKKYVNDEALQLQNHQLSFCCSLLGQGLH